MASVGVKGLSGPNFYNIDVGYSLLTYLITAEFGSCTQVGPSGVTQ